jgi:tetratricopeptide (TPR) repeat protein
MATAFFSFPMQRSIPPLIFFTYLGILTVLYKRSDLGVNILKLRVPKALGITALAILLVSGGALFWFNWRDIVCDRYFHTAMGMEKRGANRFALTAGLNAHKYNKYRMDVLSTVGRAYVTTGRLDKGIETLEKLTSTCPYNLNALFILGTAYTNSGNKEKALEKFGQVLKINPGFPVAKKIISRLKAYGKARVNLE